jgi:hypothetical protein
MTLPKYSSKEFLGITHLLFWLPENFEWVFRTWKKLFCPSGIHLFDEVWTPDKHYLYCDACDMEIKIERMVYSDVDDR